MPLIDCEINVILTWSVDYVISFATGVTKFKITDTKLYVPLVTLSTQDHAKLWQQLKSDFKWAFNWNKNQPKVSPEINYLPKVEIKNYNVMIDGKNLFDQPVKSDMWTYDNIPKILLSFKSRNKKL